MALYLDELWDVVGLQKIPDSSVDALWNHYFLQRTNKKKINVSKALSFQIDINVWTVTEHNVEVGN